MSDLVRRKASGLVRPGERVPRPLLRQMEIERQAGLVRASQLQTAAYVTHVALALVATLSAEEARMIVGSPLGEARYRMIVDHFTGVAAAKIAEMGW